MKVVIDHLAIDVPPGQRVNAATLKVAIERELARRIEERGAPCVSSAPLKSLTKQADLRTGELRTETQRAEAIATRIYQGMAR